MLKTEQFYELDETIVEFFKRVELEFSFSLDFKYVFVTNTKQKRFVEIKKIPDAYAVLLKGEILVSFNEEFFYKLDDDIKTILLEQELDKIVINFDKGTFKISQPTLKSSMGIIKKHSYEHVERANETERLLSKSKEESEKNN
jgi:hypothetical protein